MLVLGVVDEATLSQSCFTVKRRRLLQFFLHNIIVGRRSQLLDIFFRKVVRCSRSVRLKRISSFTSIVDVASIVERLDCNSSPPSKRRPKRMHKAEGKVLIFVQRTSCTCGRRHSRQRRPISHLHHLHRDILLGETISSRLIDITAKPVPDANSGDSTSSFDFDCRTSAGTPHVMLHDLLSEPTIAGGDGSADPITTSR